MKAVVEPVLELLLSCHQLVAAAASVNGSLRDSSHDKRTIRTFHQKYPDVSVRPPSLAQTLLFKRQQGRQAVPVRATYTVRSKQVTAHAGWTGPGVFPRGN